MADSVLVNFYIIFNFFLLFCKFCYSISDYPLVLLISYDGFRYDYLTKGHFPYFQYLIDNGMRAEWIINTFQTKTIPNHHSIVTGMYQETHGMVGNIMHDPLIFNETFQLENNETKWWDTGAEPIWVTNQKAAPGKRFSGSMMWFGGNVKIKGQFPIQFEGWDETIPWFDRVDELINWYLDPVSPINLGLLYIEEPDEAGHTAGPDSQLVLEKLHELNNLTGYLIKKLKKAHLFDKINIIMTSDHGMAKIDPEKVVNLDDYVNSSLYQAFDSSPVSNILPIDGMEDYVYEALSKVPHIKAYRKHNVPQNYHFSRHRRILPIVVEAEKGWMYTYNFWHKNMSIGAHGYNNSWMPMHPYLIAHGPAFKKNYTSPPFRNVDIYPLMCLLLDIDVLPNNGSLDNVKHILSDQITLNVRKQLFNWTGVFTLILVVFIIGILLGALITFKQYLPGYRKKTSVSSIGNLRPYRDFIRGHNESKEPLLLNEDA